MTAIVDKDTCIGCGACVDVCPVNAIEMPEDLAIVDANICSDHGLCVETCPVDAITLSGAMAAHGAD